MIKINLKVLVSSFSLISFTVNYWVKYSWMLKGQHLNSNKFIYNSQHKTKLMTVFSFCCEYEILVLPQICTLDGEYCWSWLFTLGKYVWYVTNISFTAHNGRPPYKTANRKSIELSSVGRYVYVSTYFAWLHSTAKLFAIFSFISYRKHNLKIKSVLNKV